MKQTLKTIREVTTYSQVIEKSKFITFVHPLFTKKDAETLLNQYREQYFDATHICYAYIVSEEGILTYKCSDDGEPSGTAGTPILNVLKANELCNVLCLVIRYFGGIKLGAGGLIRAYGKSASSAIKNAPIAMMKKTAIYQIVFSYSLIRPLDLFLEKAAARTIKKEYDLEVNYQVIFLHEDDLSQLQTNFGHELKITRLKDTWLID